MNTLNVIEAAVAVLGGYEKTGRICGVSGKAVQKWAKAGRLPRTEATGETDYAAKMAAADADGRVNKESLLSTVFRISAA
jgi:ribosomal protein S11